MQTQILSVVVGEIGFTPPEAELFMASAVPHDSLAEGFRSILAIRKWNCMFEANGANAPGTFEMSVLVLL